MMKPLCVVVLSASALFLGSCRSSVQEPLHTVRFIVAADTLPPNSVIHVSGNHADLGEWEADAVQLVPDSSGLWSRTFEFPEETVLEYKVTLGSWESEAVDETGLELPNAVLRVGSDTTVLIRVVNWRMMSARQTLLSPVRFRNKAGGIELFQGWRFHGGDDPRWASPAMDDSGWEVVDSRLLATQQLPAGLETIGWFRLRLTVDSALFGAPLALQNSQLGASEIFLNGQKLFTMGAVSADPALVRAERDLIPKMVTLAHGADQLLAVRFTNPRLDRFRAAGIMAGFGIVVYNEPNAVITNITSTVRTSTMQQWAFGVIPLVLAFTHLLLFIFYPANRENLFYALSMIGWAGIIYASFQPGFSTDPLDVLLLAKLSFVSISVALAFGLLTAYAATCERIPTLPRVLAGIAFALAVAAVVASPPWVSYGYYALIGFTAIEMVRALVRGGLHKQGGNWLIGAGSIILMVTVILQLLMGFGVFAEVLGTRIVYIYGVFALSIAVSIDLSRSVAQSNRDLKQQIAQVKTLSEQALEQERRAKEEEVNRRLLEADNRRKTEELEQARALQLSMLPQELPRLPDLEIAAFMQPATEVGGDYYDFHVREDGTLTMVIGDATGHGARAGTMVTVTKSLFHQLALESDVLTMLTRYNTSIRSLHLGNLYMAMAIARFRMGALEIAGAGMPPLLIYRAQANTIDTVALKGMPLGSTAAFPYQQQTIAFGANDLALFMTDGFPELLDPRGQQLEYDHARELFHRVASGSPQSAVDACVTHARNWANGQPFNDDITFVALKAKAR